jgi:hypothetical protein
LAPKQSLSAGQAAPPRFHLADNVKIQGMAKKNVQFVATKTVTKPTRVKFKTKSGETVSFRALRTVKEKELVKFRAKRK